MIEKPKVFSAVGLEATSDLLKIAQVSYKNKKYFIENLFSIPVQTSQITQNVKPLYIDEQNKKILSFKKETLLATTLNTPQILIRQQLFQMTKEKDIDATLDFQIEPILPYPIEEALIDRLINEKTSEQTKLTVFCAKIEDVSLHLEKWHALEIEPEIISCNPVAMAAFSEWLLPSEEPFIHIHIGEEETTGILVSKNKLSAAGAVKTGINDFISNIEEDKQYSNLESKNHLKSLDFAALSPTEFPHLSACFSQFNLNIARVCFAFKKQTLHQNKARILFTGEGALLSGLSDSLLKIFPHEILTLDNSSQERFSIEEIVRYAIPIGSALSALPGITNQVNFRQKELIYPNLWKRVKKPIFTYIAATLLLSFSIWIFGNNYILEQEDQLKKSYIQLLALLRKPFHEEEKEIWDKKLLSESVEIHSPEELTQRDIQNRIQLIDKEIRSTPEIFPLYPNTPLVSDLLAWLSNIPLIKGDDSAKESIPKIQLESLSYKMIKRPELTKKAEKYQVKVDIEFSASAPRYARELHDFLLTPNAFIDLQGDVKWNAEKGKYRATFFLKDKTVYSPK